MLMENTDCQENAYLAFQAGGISYVLPLSDVGQIVAEVPEDMPRIRLSGAKENEECSIVFQDDAGLAALTVWKVTGLVRISPAYQFELPRQARSEQNRWIAGAAYLESNGSLCYLLDCRQLRARFLGEPS